MLLAVLMAGSTMVAAAASAAAAAHVAAEGEARARTSIEGVLFLPAEAAEALGQQTDAVLVMDLEPSAPAPVSGPSTEGVQSPPYTLAQVTPHAIDASAWSFAFHEVEPGDYTIVVQPFGSRHAVHVDARRRTHVTVAVPDLAHLLVIADSMPDRATIASITWCASSPTGLRSPSVRPLSSLGAETGAAELLTVPGRYVCGMMLTDGSRRERLVEVGAGWSYVEIDFAAPPSVRVTFEREGQPWTPDARFWSGASLVAENEPARRCPMHLGLEPGTMLAASAVYEVPAAGRYRFTISQNSLRAPFSVLIDATGIPGQAVVIRLPGGS